MKLLPCPFCGGEPEEDGGMFFEFYGHERQDYSIACKKCRAEVRCDVGEHEGADAPCSCHHDTRKICAEKWNRRAAMLQGAENAETPTTMQAAPALDSSPKIAELPSGNSPVIPDGWVMVPEDPTHEMLEAGDEQFGTYDVYRRMIEAAPKLE
ncbi:Lar family restriction alleviation protein [Enterobacter asburiae]|uniref:Lar family restriction alleviation protein n=1 Tax=Enterobacter asburiae TaxID=61645 RepID=UPI001FF4158F|nr:Lar family restriction alleviation protein [Enterobacter asburiae]UOZ20277.1 Lar family restriction alleviation protein [Enterobacter asburiae]